MPTAGTSAASWCTGAQVASWHAGALGILDRLEELLNTANPTIEEVSQGFWHACAGGQRRAAERLLVAGADLNWEPDYAHGTPLDAASGLGTRRANVIGWLKEGATPPTKTRTTHRSTTANRQDREALLRGDGLVSRSEVRSQYAARVSRISSAVLCRTRRARVPRSSSSLSMLGWPAPVPWWSGGCRAGATCW